MQTSENPEAITEALAAFYQTITEAVVYQIPINDALIMNMYNNTRKLCEPTWTLTAKSLKQLRAVYLNLGAKDELYAFILAMLTDLYISAPKQVVHFIETLLGKNHPFGFVWKSEQLVISYPPELVENYFLHSNMLKTLYVQTDAGGQPTIARVLEHITWTS